MLARNMLRKITKKVGERTVKPHLEIRNGVKEKQLDLFLHLKKYVLRHR